MPNWNQWTEERFGRITNRLRQKRVEQFCKLLDLGPSDKILDLGSEDGSYLSRHYPHPENIWIADIDATALANGVRENGLGGSIVLEEDGSLPIEDGAFDAVFCNSVIEHVTIPKSEIGTLDNAEFVRRSRAHQQSFATEIERVGKKFFVQTPNRNFPIEAHSWLPLTQFLPHKAHHKLSNAVSNLWVKQWSADFILYDEETLSADFPTSTGIYRESVLGLTKSLIAYKN